jgi:hypothetical protein
VPDGLTKKEGAVSLIGPILIGGFVWIVFDSVALGLIVGLFGLLSIRAGQNRRKRNN